MPKQSFSYADLMFILANTKANAWAALKADDYDAMRAFMDAYEADYASAGAGDTFDPRRMRALFVHAVNRSLAPIFGQLRHASEQETLALIEPDPIDNRAM